MLRKLFCESSKRNNSSIGALQKQKEMYEKQLEQLRNQMASSTPKHEQNEIKTAENSKQNDNELNPSENMDVKQPSNENADPKEDDINYEKSEEYLEDNYTEEVHRDWDEDR